MQNSETLILQTAGTLQLEEHNMSRMWRDMNVFLMSVDLLVVTSYACVICLLVQWFFQHQFSLASEVLIVEHLLVRCLQEGILFLDLRLTRVLQVDLVPVGLPKHIYFVCHYQGNTI